MQNVLAKANQVNDFIKNLQNFDKFQKLIQVLAANPNLVNPNALPMANDHNNDGPEDDEKDDDDEDEEEEEYEDEINWKKYEEEQDKRREVLRLWLNEEAHCGEYYDKFIEYGFDELDIVVDCDEQQLINIGIDKIGHRLKILRAIKIYKTKHKINGDWNCNCYLNINKHLHQNQDKNNIKYKQDESKEDEENANPDLDENEEELKQNMEDNEKDKVKQDGIPNVNVNNKANKNDGPSEIQSVNDNEDDANYRETGEC